MNPRGNSILKMNAGTNGDITVNGNVWIGDWLDGKIEFPATGTARTLTISCDIDFTQVDASTTASNAREISVER